MSEKNTLELVEQLIRERDEARAARDHFKDQLRERAEALLDARAEVERLRALSEMLKGTLRDIEYDKDKVAERQKAAMTAAINDDSYAHYDGAEVVGILKAVPLVTDEEETP